MLRSLHHHLASALVVAGFVYLLATYLAGRHTTFRREADGTHRSRREAYGTHRNAWWLALTLYLLALGLCFTGFLLPMDQNAHWGTVVRLGIVETSPGIGPPVADALRGGPLLNASTLPRFYALHVSILPLAAALLLALLLRPVLAKRRLGSWLAVALAALALAAVAASYLLAAYVPAPLELPADPTDSEYVPRPEWYFLWLFQFGKYVEAVPWVRSLVLPLAGLALLYGLPLLRRQKAAGRALLAGGWCLAWIGLTALAVRDDRDLVPDRLTIGNPPDTDVPDRLTIGNPPGTNVHELGQVRTRHAQPCPSSGQVKIRRAQPCPTESRLEISRARCVRAQIR